MYNYRYLDLEGLTKYDNLLKTYIDTKLDTHLPLAGGTMSGDIDMGGGEIKNTNFELVDSLPTENLYEGRQVTYEGKIYTHHHGKWISIADDLGDLKETLSSKFVFRPTADTHSIKDEFASVKSIKGNTVVWNQLNGSVCSFSNYGVTQTQNDDGTFTLNGTATQKFSIYNIAPAIYKFLPIGHKGLFNLKHISGDIIGNLRFSYGQIQLNTNTKVIKTDSTNYRYLLATIPEGCVLNNVTFSFQVYDLTQMFGEGNEPTSVEEFEKLYSHLPADYNEGSLLNLNVDSIKSVGFNQWDEEWEYGFIDQNTGEKISGSRLVSKNFIPVLPNSKYYLYSGLHPKDALYAFEYDKEKNFIRIISMASNQSAHNNQFMTSSNACYLLFMNYYTDIVYDNNICLNLSHNGERDGEYEPYEEHIVNLPIKKYFPDGMKSAGTVYDEIVFDKNIGKYKAIQRIGSVDMGTLSWIYNSTYGGFITSRGFPSATGSDNIFKGLSAKYSYKGSYRVVKDKEMGFIYYTNVIIKDSSYPDAASFKQSLAGQILYYELAEPIETVIEDFDLVAYKANDWGTEEILSEEDTTPIKADIEYNFDTMEMVRDNYFEVDKIKKGLNEPSPLTYEEISSIFGV